MSDQSVPQPLYGEGWRAADPDMRRPGETDAEYTHRMVDQCRAQLPAKGSKP